MLLKNKRIIYFSPHPDDMALSSGGLLSRTHPDMLVVDVFSLSRYENNQIKPETEIEYITLTRKIEEISYCNHNGIKVLFGDFGDTSIQSEYDSTIVAEVKAFVERIIDGGKYDYIFLPLALGGHINHIMLQEVILKVQGIDLGKLVFYEDLPYANKCADDVILNTTTEIANQNGRTNLISQHIILRKHDIRKKVKMLCHYKSQFAGNGIFDHVCKSIFEYADRLKKATGYWCERVWIVR